MNVVQCACVILTAVTNVKLESYNAPTHAVRKREIATWLPFLGFLVPALVLSAWYIRRDFVDVVWLDAFGHVPFIDGVLDGEPLQEVFATPFFGEHLILGYRFVMIVNAWLFGLDMRLDPVLFVFAYTVTAAFVYAEVMKIAGPRRPWALLVVFLPLGFLCFSLVAPPQMLMTTQFVWASAVGLGIAFLSQRGLYDGRQRLPWITGLALVPLYFLISGAYFPGLVLGLLAMHVARSLLQPGGWLDRRFLALIGTVAACAMTYTGYLTSTQSSQSSAISSGVGRFLMDIWSTTLGYLAGLSAGVVGSHTLAGWPASALAAIGAAMAAITVLALWLFVRTKMYERTYLPIYCIFYSVGIITVVQMGRGSFAWNWITSYWYAFHLRFIIVGVVWILLHALLTKSAAGPVGPVARPVRRKAVYVGIAAGLTFVVIGQAVGNIAQWQRAPAEKAFYAEKQQALLFPNLFPDDAKVLLWPAAQVDEARAVLREHDLSSFRENEGGAQPAPPAFTGEWYDDGWVGKSGRAVVQAEIAGELSIRADFAAFVPSNSVTVRLGDEVLFSGVVQGGTARTFTAQLVPGVNVLEVTSEEAVSPASVDSGADERPLAVHITLG